MTIQAYKTKVVFPSDTYPSVMIVLPDGITYVSSSAINLQAIIGESVTQMVILGTLDNSELHDFTYTLYKNHNNEIAIDSVAISASEEGVSITYTPQESNAFTALLRIVFTASGVSQDIFLFAKASMPPAEITVSTELLDFGFQLSGIPHYMPFTVSCATGGIDKSMLSAADVSGTSLDLQSFFIDFTNAFVAPNGDISISVYYIPCGDAPATMVTQLYYGAHAIGNPITLTGHSDYINQPHPTALTAPDGQMYIAYCYVNSGTTSFRISTCEITDDPLGEYAIHNLDVVIGLVLQPNKLAWILLDYTPQQAEMVYPRVKVTGVYF